MGGQVKTVTARCVVMPTVQEYHVVLKGKTLFNNLAAQCSDTKLCVCDNNEAI